MNNQPPDSLGLTFDPFDAIPWKASWPKLEILRWEYVNDGTFDNDMLCVTVRLAGREEYDVYEGYGDNGPIVAVAGFHASIAALFDGQEGRVYLEDMLAEADFDTTIPESDQSDFVDIFENIPSRITGAVNWATKPYIEKARAAAVSWMNARLASGEDDFTEISEVTR
jgi:hypothetical protein